VTPSIDPAELERAFGRPVPAYEVEPIDPHLRIHSVTGGVFRVRAGDDTAVLKIVRHGVDGTPDGLWLSGAEPRHRNYWKREWLAFDAGLLGALPGRLRAPRTLLTTEHDNGDCWLWMEDVTGRHGAGLTLDDYAQVGHDLGTTQGAYAAGTAALPDQPWLSRSWLRGWVDACAPMGEAIGDDTVWRGSSVGYLSRLRVRAAAVWARREELLAIVEAAPPTVVHCDFWPANVFVGDAGTVAVDWSQVGLGTLAQDLDQMTLDPVWMMVRPDTDPRMLERRVLPAYLDGLRAAGLDVTETELWRWYAAAGGVRYVPLLGGQPRTAADPELVAGQERRFGRAYADIAAAKFRALERAVELGELALA
jgi:hypothetical protein